MRLREIDGFIRKSGKAIMVLTVREILYEEIARKLPGTRGRKEQDQ